MKKLFTPSELRAAYEICLLVQSHCAEVIASGEAKKNDLEWHRLATKFIKAYESINAFNIAKSGKGGSLGKALMILEGIQGTLKDVGKAIDKTTQK
jgi:hypothetical protein